MTRSFMAVLSLGVALLWSAAAWAQAQPQPQTPPDIQPVAPGEIQLVPGLPEDIEAGAGCRIPFGVAATDIEVTQMAVVGRARGPDGGVGEAAGFRLEQLPIAGVAAPDLTMIFQNTACAQLAQVEITVTTCSIEGQTYEACPVPVTVAEPPAETVEYVLAGP